MRTIDDIKDANKAAGLFYFEPDTMRFFKSRVLDFVAEGPGGVFFVTSEKNESRPRLYSVREFNPTSADITTHGQFQEHDTAAQARAEAARAARTA